MSYKRILFILIGGFIALLLMNTNIEVTAQDPSECEAGQYSKDSTDNICVDAEPGYYVPLAGATEQIACPLGTYQPAHGATNCNPAAPGHFVDTTAAVAQTACAPGTYQPFAGAISCLLADPGYFVDTFAATQQTMCPANTTSDAGAVECTPIPTGYAFSGFLQPVDNLPTVNVVKAGRAIPVKFSLGDDFGLDIMMTGYPLATAVACDNSAPTGAIEETVSAGSSSLSYDADTDTYTYVWKTNRAWADSCRLLTVMLDDGSVHQASFKFTR